MHLFVVLTKTKIQSRDLQVTGVFASIKDAMNEIAQYAECDVSDLHVFPPDRGFMSVYGERHGQSIGLIAQIGEFELSIPSSAG